MPVITRGHLNQLQPVIRSTQSESDWLKNHLNRLFSNSHQSVSTSIEVDLLESGTLHHYWAPSVQEMGSQKVNKGRGVKEWVSWTRNRKSKKLLWQSSRLYTPPRSLQRPYVMRSSTPANEIVQIFHKVHPSYPAAWSLEMKSLLRKVRLCTYNSHYNRSLIQPFPSFQNLLSSQYRTSAIAWVNECPLKYVHNNSISPAVNALGQRWVFCLFFLFKCCIMPHFADKTRQNTHNLCCSCIWGSFAGFNLYFYLLISTYCAFQRPVQDQNSNQADAAFRRRQWHVSRLSLKVKQTLPLKLCKRSSVR